MSDMTTAFPLPVITEPDTVVLLATGGTIAGSGDSGRETGYTSGALSVAALIEAVPQLRTVGNIAALQICNINSDDISADIWLQLARTINTLAADPRVRGFVITHGTDTMEETAYFLHLTVHTDKPVVLTGSMRPATAISADGPMNLYQAVCTAAADESRERGVLVAFSDRIYSARSMTKRSTYTLEAISAADCGCLGLIRDDRVCYYSTPTRRHTVNSEFSAALPTSLPPVSIIYFAADTDPELLRFAAGRSAGLVIAGAGAGEFSQAFIEAINSLSLPVVISSRIGSGIITQDAVLCPNSFAADDLPPHKAAVLLRLALAYGLRPDELYRIFAEY